MVVSHKAKVKVFYNDLENHVTCTEGLMIEEDDFKIILQHNEKRITIPMNKIVRIEEDLL